MMKEAQVMNTEKLFGDLVDQAGLPDKAVYSIGEVARILQMSRETVRILCDSPARENHLYCVRTPGGQRRIPARAIIAWLKWNGEDGDV